MISGVALYIHLNLFWRSDLFLCLCMCVWLWFKCLCWVTFISVEQLLNDICVFYSFHIILCFVFHYFLSYFIVFIFIDYIVGNLMDYIVDLIYCVLCALYFVTLFILRDICFIFISTGNKCSCITVPFLFTRCYIHAFVSYLYS